MTKATFLTEEECYCALDEFYARVAEKIGYGYVSEDDASCKFDCRKICVTPSVYEKIKSYYMSEMGISNLFVATIFAVCGPKMTVQEFPNKKYIAEVEDSFIVEDWSKKDLKFRYMLLDRLRQDCDYYLKNKGSANCLWANTEQEQIHTMIDIWNSFPEEGKPEWLTMEQIKEFAKKMQVDI